MPQARPPIRSPRGFTLVEMLTVTAIIGILAALAGVGLMYGLGRARMANASFEVASLFPLAQLRARSKGLPHYVVFVEEAESGRVEALILERDERGVIPPPWDSVDVTELASLGGRIVQRVPLSKQGFFSGVGLGQLSDAPFPSPFAAVPHAPSGSDKALRRACSFCVLANGGVIGAVRFAPSGLVEPATVSGAAGGAVAIRVDTPGEAPRSRVIAVAAPAGTVKVYQ